MMRCSVSFQHMPHDECDGNPGEAFATFAKETHPAEITMAMLLQTMNRMTACLDPPVEVIVCSAETWDFLKSEFVTDCAKVEFNPLFGIKLLTRPTEIEAKVLAVKLHSEGVRVRFIEGRK